MPQPSTIGAPASRARARWRARLLALLGSCAVLFLLEAGLRVAGFGRPHPLFVPLDEDPDWLRANPDVVKRFLSRSDERPNLWIHPVRFRREKAPDTFRIFVQGESTAEGYPYGYGASPAGMLQQRLQHAFPERTIEVVTTAMCAVSSYVLEDFVDEILEQEPDAVVIYAGHNEYVGLLGVGSNYSLGLGRSTVRFLLKLRELRLYQLVQRVLPGDEPERMADPSRTLMSRIVREKKIPLDSPLYRRGLEQYRANLGALLARYRAAGVPVFVGTVVSNERDQPPFTSGHRTGADVAAWHAHFDAGLRALASGDLSAALAELDRAVALDDLHAEGHHARGQALERLGRYAEARVAYLAAKDRDELRFRAPEALNRVLREVTREQGAHVVEVQEAFAREAEHGIVGNDLMLEHLHPNLRGYFVLADAFHDALRAEGLIGAWEQALPREQAWAEIPVSEVDRLYGEYRIRSLTSDWPFSRRGTLFRVERAPRPVERIAQDYYNGRKEWPAAMRALLEHYRRIGDERESARVGVLLAEAFPNELQQQVAAVELLLMARRPEAGVYLRRALALASLEQREELLALESDPRYAALDSTRR